MSALKRLVIKGVIWTILGYGTGQILRFGGNLVLTHLLTPELFGLMALVNIFLTGLTLFSDVGLGMSIIQNKRGDEPSFLNTAWTIQIIRGIGIWIVCLLIAWPLSLLYENADLQWLIPVVGLTALMAAFSSTALFSLERDMDVKRSTLIDLVVQAVGIGVMIVWAYFNRTIWALVAGALVSGMLKLIWSHQLDPKRPNRLDWDTTAIAEILSIGRWIFISTALTFVAEQCDRLMLGKLFSLEQLGVYGIALMLSDVPRSITMALCGRVIFPSFTKFVDLPRSEFRAKILHSRWPLVLALTAGMAVLIGVGDLIVSHLYDERYAAASWILPILALGIWPRLLCTTIDPALFALGKPQYATYGNFTRFVITSVGVLGAAFLLPEPMKFPGAVIAVALNDLFFYIAINYGLCREKLNCLSQDLLVTGILLLTTGLIVLGRLSIGWGQPFSGML